MTRFCLRFTLYIVFVTIAKKFHFFQLFSTCTASSWTKNSLSNVLSIVNQFSLRSLALNKLANLMNVYICMLGKVSIIHEWFIKISLIDWLSFVCVSCQCLIFFLHTSTNSINLVMFESEHVLILLNNSFTLTPFLCRSLQQFS